jgi:hypothetical protein
MGDLDEAIRDHLELKRRRGADPAEVAREEQEALSPVTRSHPIVVPEDLEQDHPHADEPARNGDTGHTTHPAHAREHEAHSPEQHADVPAPTEDPSDATQEFRVVLGDQDDWLEDDEES